MNYAEKQGIVQELLRTLTRTSSQGFGRVNCPFCVERVGKADRKRCFSVAPDTGWFRCFRCGVTGRLNGFADERYAPKEEQPQQPSPQAAQPPESFTPVYEGAGLTAFVLKPARDYLASRNLTVEQQAQARIGACAQGKYQKRVVVPVLDADGDSWLGWVARAWQKDAERKYLYPSGMVRSLYNHAALLVETTEPVYVVEGVFDALALWPHAVAVLGKPTDAHLEALAAAKRPVVFVLDGDAHEEGWAYSMRLKLDGQRSGNVRLAPGVDPDEVDLADLWDAAHLALQSSESVRL